MTCYLGLGVVSYEFLVLNFDVICRLSSVITLLLFGSFPVFKFLLLYQGYDMSTFVRRYGKYLNEKASSYTEMGYDFCRLKRG